MIANRQAQGLVMEPQPRRDDSKKPTKAEKAKEREPGSKAMRYFIIEEKPGKRVVREHFKALVELECASESDSD
jgi:hypothetical protein